MQAQLLYYFNSVRPYIAHIQKVVKQYKIDVLVKLGISLGLVYLLYTKIDVTFLQESLALVDKGLLVGAFVLTFLVSLVYVLRLFVVLRLVSKVSFSELYLINRFGNLLNFFLIGNLGQEFSKLVYLKDIPKKQLVYLLFFDRVSGFFAMSMILLVALPIMPEVAGFRAVHYYVLVSVLSIVLLSILGYIKKKAHIPLRAFLSSTVLSLVYVIGLITIAIVTFRSVGVTTVDVEMLYVTPLLSMLLLLPISINGIGLREYFLTFILAIAPEKVVLYSLLGYIIFIILSLPGLLYYFKIIHWRQDAVE